MRITDLPRRRGAPQRLCVLLLATLLPLAHGCASSPTQRPDEPLISLSEDSERTTGLPAQAAPGTIRRADLQRVLADSPGRFLATVDTVPELEGRSFRGWRVRGFNAGFPGRGAPGVAVQPGDVVVRVNAHGLERPEQFIEAWQAAGARPELTVELLRDGKPVRLTWRIVDAN